MISAATSSSSRRRARGPSAGIVQRLEDPAELQLRLQHGATRRLGGVRGDHELERHLARAAGLLLRLDATRGEPPERLGERFPRDPLLALVAAPAAHPVPRLGDVGELEIEAERTQDGRRPLLAERAHAGSERRSVGRRARAPGLTSEVPDALDIGQQILAVLLDEHPPERIAHEADVPSQGVVPAARRARGALVGSGARHEPKPMGSPSEDSTHRNRHIRGRAAAVERRTRRITPRCGAR